MKKEEAFNKAKKIALDFVKRHGLGENDLCYEAFMEGFKAYRRLQFEDAAYKKKVKYCTDEEFRKRVLETNFRSREKKFRLV